MSPRVPPPPPRAQHAPPLSALRKLTADRALLRSLSVFNAEVPPGPKRSRNALEKGANVRVEGKARDVPVLFSVVRHCQNQK